MTRSFFLSSALLAVQAAAQSATPYTDAKSGIKFNGYKQPSGFTLGIALPETPGSDFIGQIVAPITNDGGWAGFSMGTSMVGSLLVTAWPHGDQILSSFRKATGYSSPAVASGDFALTEIPDGTYVNDTAFAYTFLCSNCIGDDALLLSDTSNVLAWAYSKSAVATPASASSTLTMHDAGFGLFGLPIADAKSANYDTWAALATGSAGGSSNSTGNSTIPVGGGSSTNDTASISDSTYDYIVAGAGPAGIIVAERLAESGASVLLIERGEASLASTGNNNTLSWNNSVTLYDVPALGYYLSKAGQPAYCTDTADVAGCLLGGGTMINAMMFVKPQSRDFDDKWPSNWKWADVADSADRLYERNPGQNYGSMDGLRYNNEAYGILSTFFKGQGFTETDMIKGDHNARQNVYAYPPWDTANGLRNGPVRSYLPLAQKQKDFKLMLNTKVIRAVRDGSTISGVETETSSGARVIYNVKQGGSVILAAGTMSTPRLLFNSGIGPSEQLKTVASGTSGVTLPDESEWIDLPVGAEIKDHVIFTLKFKTNSSLTSPPTSTFLSPNQTAIDQFAKGSGVLAQSGQRLNFWTSVNTTSGKEMFIQGTCNGPANDTIQMKIYLTHGLTSTGALRITADGATELTTHPWLQTDDDKEAITMFMDGLLKMTQAPDSALTLQSAGSTTTGSNVTGAALIKEHSTAAHYIGTAKMGTKGDSGVVVDTDTKVYGTENLFVVDASMHPDLPTGNTQAMVMVAAERAAERILAVGSGSSANGTSASSALPAAASSVSASAAMGTGSPSIPSSASSPQATATSPYSAPAQSPSAQKPGNNGNNPWWKVSPDNSWWSRPSSTSTSATPTPTPAQRSAQNYLRRARKNTKRRNAVKIPVGPVPVQEDSEALEKKASFLDSYNW
ncbi:FAD/NAD(P)-binding domain-containing protein [Byssothecium circinans]|uniref:FAD/NAD(P)-binding domain-containing protein n=1 Tax=Byssothecium circinans TaxID=147558 RepID=A0A6A5T688_9PLEO|nr:FAD/NAD(P)-binding domain-containing protein [Byssothecium circinans]